MLGFLRSLLGDPARHYLGPDLGEIVTTLLERDTPKSWSPDPSKWEKQ